jgi:2-polyprenyl-6-methoxyphenol hydroxylase-like FAD-dependent oxidoreductase
MSCERVLIVGGGPAGATAAIALRAKGIEVEIVEIERVWAPLGVGLLLQGPPLRALASIGLIDACVAAGFPHEEVTFMNTRGDVLNVTRSPQVAGPQYPPSLAMSRPALHQVLAARVRDDGTAVRLGTTVEAVLHTDRGVEVAFTDGSTGTYDLLVAADGIHSRVRELVFADTPPPRYTGQLIWRTTLRRPAELRNYPIIFGPSGKLGLVPVSEEHMYLYLLQNSAHDDRPDRSRWHDLLREQLAGYNAQVDRIREEIVDPAQVDLRGLQMLLVAPPWHRGRVVLIGDAAHATTPHLAYGIGLAVEDSIVLAEVLAQNASVETALEQFTQRRYERCRTVVENSVLLGHWEQHPEITDADPRRVFEETFAIVAQPL